MSPSGASRTSSRCASTATNLTASRHEAAARHRSRRPDLSSAKYQEVRQWFASAVSEHEYLVSEVTDYELRRELIRIHASRSLARLDELSRELRYVPVTTATWRSAANLWAWLHRTGKATAAEHGLDGDVLIAAQAIAEDAAVVPTNPRHFQPLVSAREWHELAT